MPRRKYIVPTLSERWDPGRPEFVGETKILPTPAKRVSANDRFSKEESSWPSQEASVLSKTGTEIGEILLTRSLSASDNSKGRAGNISRQRCRHLALTNHGCTLAKNRPCSADLAQLLEAL